MAATGTSEIWQARIDRGLAAELRADAGVLGLTGRTDTVRAALQLLHQRAAEERMARGVDDFYGRDTPALPIGVRRAPARSGSEPDAAA
jgi:hypothetical protein